MFCNRGGCCDSVANTSSQTRSLISDRHFSISCLVRLPHAFPSSANCITLYSRTTSPRNFWPMLERRNHRAGLTGLSWKFGPQELIWHAMECGPYELSRGWSASLQSLTHSFSRNLILPWSKSHRIRPWLCSQSMPKISASSSGAIRISNLVP